jgi:hypothetical protein
MGITGPAVDYLCTIVLIARVCQSMVHVSHVQTRSSSQLDFGAIASKLRNSSSGPDESAKPPCCDAIHGRLCGRVSAA